MQLQALAKYLFPAFVMTTVPGQARIPANGGEETVQFLIAISNEPWAIEQ